MSFTLVNTPVSRGKLADMRFTTYNTGGTVMVERAQTTGVDIFDDSPTADDFMLVYASNPFREFDITFSGTTVPISGTDVVLAYEYYNGTAWTALPGLTDGTSGLTTTGTISWTIPTDWELISRSTETPTNTSSTSNYMIRVRLVSFTSMSEGGAIYNYPGITQDYIAVSGETFDFDDIYDADVAGGWGVVTKDNNNFTCSVGLSVVSSTWEQNQGVIQIGNDRAGEVILDIGRSGVTLKFNIPTGDGRTLKQTGQTQLTLGTRGSGGTIWIYVDGDSQVHNTSIKALDEQYYCRLALKNIDYDNPPATWKNVTFSKMICYDAHYFDRINFQYIQYILTNGAAVYDNCYMNGIFAVDQGYDITITRPVIDSRTTDTYYTAGTYSTTATYQHRCEVLCGTWLKPSLKYCNYGKNYTSSRTSNGQQYIEIGSNYVQMTTKDKAGDDVETKVYITDQYGNNACWEMTDLEMVSGDSSKFPQSPIETNLSLIDATDVEVGDQYLCYGEIFTVVTKSGNDLTITRGDEDSARRTRSSGNRNNGTKFRKRVPYLTCNGSLSDIYLIEFLYHKYSVDGGTTTTGHIERYYGDYNIKVEADGYETWSFDGDITNETFFNIKMRPMKQLAITQDGVFINTDPENITDDLCLIKL